MGRYGTAFIAGAIIGGVAGTAVTLWRAPQSGRITRSQFGEQIIAHAGPAGGALSAAAAGLNSAGVRIVQGTNIATRFVEELIHPSTPGIVGDIPTSVTMVTAPAPTLETTPQADGPVVNPTGEPISSTSGQANAYRSAAMNVTSIFGDRRRL